ncbi:MFS transporter [Rhizosaccharibacter radicis]|uniref:MFS transporter n=1 Tax=Rhizosaccharibacter radicis TaxID=2782605 RepID=A0ABT1VZF0_9PROT|nr:MFS transporter [Acetobacteraceae bacterium KSS12]
MLGSFTTVLAMTLLLPFLPLYVEQLGMHGHAAVVQWSAAAFAATYLAAGLVAPLWGLLADRWGRKPILIRASLGMALCMSLIGTVSNVWQLVGLRLLAGFLGGYASGATVLVATQTPRGRSAWALGVLSSGIMAGNLAGPVLGGVLPPLIGIRRTFFLAGGLIFLSALATIALIREAPRPPRAARAPLSWRDVPDRRLVMAMLGTGTLLTLANMSVEPIITVFMAQLVPAGRVTMMAGLAMSSAALGSVLAAPAVGRLADRVGARPVVLSALVGCALLLLPQALVTAGWQLVLLRLLMGAALAGLMPAITSVVRHAVPERIAGQVLAWGITTQYVGQVSGPMLGGAVGGHLGMRPVFLVTSAVMLAGAAVVWLVRPRDGAAPPAAT